MYFDIDGASWPDHRSAKARCWTTSPETTSYSVTVTATDSVGLTDSIDVTIMVTDVEEAPTFTCAASRR